MARPIYKSGENYLLKSEANHRYGVILRLSIAITIAVGIVGLSRLADRVTVLTSLIPTYATMKANTALAFILSAGSLWLLRLPVGKRK